MTGRTGYPRPSDEVMDRIRKAYESGEPIRYMMFRFSVSHHSIERWATAGGWDKARRPSRGRPSVPFVRSPDTDPMAEEVAFLRRRGWAVTRNSDGTWQCGHRRCDQEALRLLYEREKRVASQITMTPRFDPSSFGEAVQ